MRRKTAILMMQKNEDVLLKFWFAYHSQLVGAGNLFIFDNGSNDKSVVAMLKEIEEAGGNVIRSHNKAEDFCNKGLVFLDYMQNLRKAGFKIFIPLDCDEFIGIESDRGLSIDSEQIFEELAKCLRHQACQISHAYLNHPFEHDLFRRSDFKKVYGTFRDIDWLGEGFHHVRAPMEKSRLCYVHYHYRPFEDFRTKTAAKISAHGQELSRNSLIKYANSDLNGHQNAGELLMTYEEYRYSFEKQRYENQLEPNSWFRSKLGSAPFEVARISAGGGGRAS